MLDLPLNGLTLAVTTLAAWQLTTLIFYDRGPFRLLFGVRDVLKRIGLERLTACIYCLTVWTSLIVVVVAYPLSWQTPLLALCVGGAVTLIEMRLGRSSTQRSAQQREAAYRDATSSPASAPVSAPGPAPAKTEKRETVMANG